MRNYRSATNLLAVSAAAKETAINTEQTMGLSLLADTGDVLVLDKRRDNNAKEMTGKEEPDTVYDLGQTSSGKLTFNKAQPQHFAFLSAYALGSLATGPAGTGYQHVITPIPWDLDENRSLPSFTAAQRFGQTVLKRRFASMFVDSMAATFSKDDWCKLTASLKGTGKYTDNVVEEVISAAGNATTLTLAANGVEGATAAVRLDNVQRIRVELAPGVWTEVAYSVVSATTPAAVTITSPGGTVTPVNYRVLYIPVESGWMAFPSRIAETPLRVAQMTLKMGGAWSGTAFTGGKTLAGSVKSVEWTVNNGLAIEFVPGSGGAYASKCFRPARTQTLKLNKEFRDYILEQHILANDTFGFYILAEGALYDATNKYQVEIIFPKVAVLTAPQSIDGQVLAQAGDLQVLQDDTYGSVIVRVQNLQATYCT